jgi:hypothetical protein
MPYLNNTSITYTQCSATDLNSQLKPGYVETYKCFLLNDLGTSVVQMHTVLILITILVHSNNTASLLKKILKRMKREMLIYLRIKLVY